jgi:diaminobutyrate-2-oxoglutarate transaminase
MDIIDRLESDVRSYVRDFPTVFDQAACAWLTDVEGRRWLDLFAGAGALNYGHNPPVLRDALVDYITHGGVTHSLDMASAAKVRFLETFERRVLKPRGLRYKVQFPGPTGTNAVEAALKLARKATGRTQVVAFTNAFHGMTLGALAVTGNARKRGGAGVALHNTVRAPFDGYHGDDYDALTHLERLLDDPSSGVDAPAAFLLETVQAEGGVNVASPAWLKGLAELAKRHEALLIVDDIQVGCGRTGPFFSFERAGIEPDIVCLSKSLSGFGLPFAATLMKPELDCWAPGEHNGTFRGNNHAFVTAAAALDAFWADDALSRSVEALGALATERLGALAARHDGEVRGLGLIQGVEFADPDMAQRISREAFRRGVIIETAGPRGEVLKLLPPLVITEAELREGLDVLDAAADAVAGRTAEECEALPPLPPESVDADDRPEAP